jgi:hypothetical protein
LNMELKSKPSGFQASVVCGVMLKLILLLNLEPVAAFVTGARGGIQQQALVRFHDRMPLWRNVSSRGNLSIA